MFRKLLIFLFLITGIFINAQNKTIDSLKLALKNAKHDTVICNILTELIDKSEVKERTGFISQLKNLSRKNIDAKTNYTFFFKTKLGYAYKANGIVCYLNSDYQAAKEKYDSALVIFNSIGDMREIAYTYGYLGSLFDRQTEFNKGLEYHFKAKKIFEELGYKPGQRKSLNNIGLTFKDLSNYPKALEYLFQALKASEELGDVMAVGRSQNNIGLVYNELSNYQEALRYYKLALTNCEAVGDKHLLGRLLNNIGLAYEGMLEYDSALVYYKKSIDKSEIVNDKYMMGITFSNIGLINLEQSNNQVALEYFLKGLNISEEVKDSQNTARTFGNLGRLYSNMKNYQLAESYFKKALALAEQFELYDLAKYFHYHFSLLYEKMNKPVFALKEYKKYAELKDSIFSKENAKKLLYAEMANEFETKKAIDEAKHKLELENQKAISEEKNRKQSIIILSVGLGLILVIIFSAFILRSLKTSNSQKKIIELKSAETEGQKIIIEQKHKEITDSINYAERIQRSFLATKEILDENMKEYFILFKPKDVVSGDFYWASKLSNGNFAFVTADSTGHGVPGAIMSLLNITSLEKAIETETSPDKILNHTRKTIIERLKKDGSEEGGKDGMDATLVVLNKERTKLICALANNPVWILRNNEILVISPDKMPVGKHDKDQIPFIQHEIDLEKGDIIYTLTDGMPDQFGGPNGKKYKYAPLKEFLKSISSLPMTLQKEKLKEEFDRWKGNLEQIDDVTIVGVRI